MTTSNQVYKIAKAHLGHKGSHARSFCGMSSGPYCCAFVTMCMHKSGGKKLFYGGKKCTYCPNAIKWAKANLAEVPPYLAMRMDLIFFDWQPNGTPDHIGFVLDKIDTKQIRTLEGNTSGGIVAVKTRKGYIQGIFRPHYTPEQMPTKAELVVDGDFGYKSIYMLQVALGGLTPDAILGKQTVKALQRKVGASPDGSWGPKTSRLIQSKLLGFSGKSVDGDFGPKSVRALQTWINAKCFPAPKKPITTAAKKPVQPKPAAAPATKKTAAKVTNAQKLINKMKELAWAYGTAKKKYAYKTGAPKAVCKKAMKKYGWADNRAEMSDCGNFVSTVVREAGVSKTFKALHGKKTPFPKSEKGFSIVLTGKKVPSGFLKPGDIIRYKKKNGNQHVLFYFGDGKVCEASHHNRFGAIIKDEKKYNNSSIAKIGTVQVLRAKG